MHYAEPDCLELGALVLRGAYIAVVLSSSRTSHGSGNRCRWRSSRASCWSVVTSLRATRGTVHVVSEIKPILLPAARCRRRLACLAARTESDKNADQSERQGPVWMAMHDEITGNGRGLLRGAETPKFLHTFPDLPCELASSWPSVISRCVGR